MQRHQRSFHFSRRVGSGAYQIALPCDWWCPKCRTTLKYRKRVWPIPLCCRPVVHSPTGTVQEHNQSRISYRGERLAWREKAFIHNRKKLCCTSTFSETLFTQTNKNHKRPNNELLTNYRSVYLHEPVERLAHFNKWNEHTTILCRVFGAHILLKMKTQKHCGHSVCTLMADVFSANLQMCVCWQSMKLWVFFFQHK